MKTKTSGKWLKRAAVLSVAAFALSSAMGEIVPWVFEEGKTVRTEASVRMLDADDSFDRDGFAAFLRWPEDVTGEAPDFVLTDSCRVFEDDLS